LHAAGGGTQELVSELASRGIELIVDARLDLNGDADAMRTKCDEAGLHYLQVPAGGGPVDVPGAPAKRYADLALRHRTCVVTDGTTGALVGLIADQHRAKAISLDAYAPGPLTGDGDGSGSARCEAPSHR
jgi:hypothetical protein